MEGVNGRCGGGRRTRKSRCHRCLRREALAEGEIAEGRVRSPREGKGSARVRMLLGCRSFFCFSAICSAVIGSACPGLRFRSSTLVRPRIERRTSAAGGKARARLRRVKVVPCSVRGRRTLEGAHIMSSRRRTCSETRTAYLLIRVGWAGSNARARGSGGCEFGSRSAHLPNMGSALAGRTSANSEVGSMSDICVAMSCSWLLSATPAGRAQDVQSSGGGGKARAREGPAFDRRPAHSPCR